MKTLLPTESKEPEIEVSPYFQEWQTWNAPKDLAVLEYLLALETVLTCTI